MPKDTSIQKILLIGSGPIVIGQGCEFDYSGVQACKALKEEGYTVILVNSNPATIMTDPEFAHRTYIEPITPEVVEKIIERERPDALLPTLGGQTALNCAMELWRRGVVGQEIAAWEDSRPRLSGQAAVPAAGQAGGLSAVTGETPVFRAEPKQHAVRMIGANPLAIHKGEDRQAFKEAMIKIGLDMPRSGTAHTIEEGRLVLQKLGTLPLIIRPAFTLGGSGGGIAYNREEFETIVARGLDLSPVSEVLIEESLLGWKEFEMEVMRDRADNCVIICSIENVDPMGVHTGDSITVAPIQTLTDREFQLMRDASFAIIREIGVETGGSNIQFAVHPETGRMIVIEMNPRVSRSSALASKATGFPIAKIAAKLAVGYTLDEVRNDITRETPASFEPTIDYVVVKCPRFTFEKFPQADPVLTTQMKSVGEAMAIGRTFKEALQKALRSLEIKRFGLIGDGKDVVVDDDTLRTKLTVPNAERIFFLGLAFQRGWTVEEVFEMTKIDRWFLENIRQIVAETFVADDEASHALRGKIGNWLNADAEMLREDEDTFRKWMTRAKKFGFSDRQIASQFGVTDEKVRHQREEVGVKPTYRLVDTCAAEFEAYTPYYYSTYGDENERRDSGKKKIIILGGGPNRIGQGIEFDYCCVHAAFALRELGFETIMVNSNPETVSTDYDTSDKLYFEPLTLEDVLNICEQESENLFGVIVQFGGQTPLNLAAGLQAAGVPVIGTSPKSIEIAEDRKLFGAMLDKLGIRQTSGGTAVNEEQAIAVANRIGYPVLVRPSFVLGGRGMELVHNEIDLRRYMRGAMEISHGLGQGASPTAQTGPTATQPAPPSTEIASTPTQITSTRTARTSTGTQTPSMPTKFTSTGTQNTSAQTDSTSSSTQNTSSETPDASKAERPILIDHFLEDALEVDVDCISDGTTVVIGAIMEHIEEAGIHSGDSACAIPPFTLKDAVKAEIAKATKAMALALEVKGLMNVQFAVKDDVVYVLEVNPRASRTAPFVSKAIGVALPKLAAKIMAGATLQELGFTEEIHPKHFSVKEAVFPFIRFPGIDIMLGPEMKSTGEVMGIDQNLGLAYAKAQMAAGPPLPSKGNVFLSLADRQKPKAIEIARGFADLGFTLYATSGTAAALRAAGIPVKKLFKLNEGRPNALDMIKNGELQLIINTPAGKVARADEVKIRSTATGNRIPVITTLRAAKASLDGIRALKEIGLHVKPLQEWHQTP